MSESVQLILSVFNYANGVAYDQKILEGFLL